MDVLDFSERPHRGGWTLRSALVRLAQPHPELVAELLSLSRRLDAVLKPNRQELEAMTESEFAAFPLSPVVHQFDSVAQALAEWAHAGPENPPDNLVIQAIDSIGTAFDQLGVPDEPADGGSRGRRGDRAADGETKASS